MIISIYGIPRSGKDTFINELIKTNKIKKCIHLKGSDTLNSISYETYGQEFRNLDLKKQEETRILFTDKAKELSSQYDLVIVDGHYSFPHEGGFSSVFTESDLALYDAFFYLKRNSDEIVRNFAKGDKKDYAEFLSAKEKIDEWMYFEIENMKFLVESQDKDFVILDSNQDSIDFVCHFDKSSKDIAKEISDEILNHSKENVVLTDLDKTVSINDLTVDFIEHSKLDSSFPKLVFGFNYYTQYQFYRFHKYLLSSKCYDQSLLYALSKLAFNDKLIEDLQVLKKEAMIVGITTGLADAWKYKNNELNLFDKIYGYTKENKMIVTPLIKRLVSNRLSQEVNTLAIGDSIIDLGMIQEAKYGFVISMQKLDKRIIDSYDKGLINKKIYQPFYSKFKYNFLEEREIRW